MKRHLVLGTLVAVGALSLALSAQQRAPQPKPSAAQLKVDKLKDNLFVISSAPGADFTGGNTAVFVASDGVTVVDTKVPGWGQPLLEKIKTITNKPVVRIINTHTHFDHVGSNIDFPANVDIVTQENTKTYMDQANPVTGMQTGPQPNIFKQAGGKGMPKRTFKDKMTIGKGADEVDLYYFGCAHTGGDAWVVFPALRTMHAGDAFAGKDQPIMDKNNGGCGIGYADTIRKAANGVKNVDTVITGHAPTTMTMQDVATYADYTRDFVDAIRAAKNSGKTLDAVVKTWKPAAKYAGYNMTPEADRVRTNAQVVWDELK
jgi:cyclase